VPDHKWFGAPWRYEVGVPQRGGRVPFQLMARIDYDRAAASFDHGRARPPEQLEEWHRALSQYLPADDDMPVLDLGAGTGIWSGALADWFHVRVVALEPSAGMRARARAKGQRSGLMVAGDAMTIPLRDDSCRAAWLSTVVHHLPDLVACAAELRRVLMDEGPVLIRNSFPGRNDEIPLFSFFPGAKAVADTFPTLEATEAAFATAGFKRVTLRRVYEQRDATMVEALRRVRAMRHSDSTLIPLSDEEFSAGLAAMEAARAARRPVPPTGLDLLVLQARHLIRRSSA
jgi:SAM-dependent methyltransferase